MPGCPLESQCKQHWLFGAVHSLPSVPLGCWGGCGQSWGRVSDPTVPQPRLVSQPGSQPAQHGAVAKLELMNELLSLHYLQEGGNIWGERVHSFLLK